MSNQMIADVSTSAGDHLRQFSVPASETRPCGGRPVRAGRVTGCLRMLALAWPLLAASGVARSANIELLGGRSVTSHGRSTPIVAAEWLGKSRQWKGIAFQPDIGLTYVFARHHQDGDFSRGTAVAAVGVRFPELPHHLFFSLQLGAAGPETPALSSAQQFVSSLGWSDHGIVVLVRHISNGSTREPNLGETMLLVGANFKIR